MLRKPPKFFVPKKKLVAANAADDDFEFGIGFMRRPRDKIAIQSIARSGYPSTQKSREATSRHRWPEISSSRCSVPKARELNRARSRSSFSGLSFAKPSVNVLIGVGDICASRPVTIFESSPPDKNEATGTSLIKRYRTACSTFSRTSSMIALRDRPVMGEYSGSLHQRSILISPEGSTESVCPGMRVDTPSIIVSGDGNE